ncbi:MAG: tetratricopeptide repeat protein [Planctomycetales bacterium]|nr:tetratricopeptide repeat protein [Planctomycetales bacterium]
MQPLRPEDLLLRHTPVDTGRWFEDTAEETSATRVVPLERFQQLEQVLRDTPINVDPYLELARIYLQNSRWGDAKRVLDLACARFPEHEESQFLREEAQIARSLQLHAEARQEHAAEPTRLTREKLERCNIELNVLRENVCRARLARHPDQIELNIPLATALYNLGQSPEAIRVLQQAVGSPKLRAIAALQLGRVLEKEQRIPEALSAYRRAALFRVPLPPLELRLQALSAAADLAERSQLIDSARRYVGLLLELRPDDAQLAARFQALRQRPL